jgi:hypothetical protein
MDWGGLECSQTSPKYEVMRWKNFQAGLFKKKKEFSGRSG